MSHRDPAWSFADDRWASVQDARLNASVRLIPATRLCEHDSCMYEAGALLTELFDTTDIEALGGPRATMVLYSMLRQFASENPAAAIVLQAIRKPVTVLRSTDSREATVAPRSTPKQLDSGSPKLVLYHTGSLMLLPKQTLGLRADPLRIYFPDRTHQVLTTIVVREWASALSGREANQNLQAYAGRQRSIGTHPDVYEALRLGRPLPLTATGPSLNAIRITPRAGNRGFDSVRFGVNFTPCGGWVTDLWTKTSDLHDFLRMYSDAFTDVLRPLLDGDP